MKIAYKLRLIPFALGLITLITGLVLHFLTSVFEGLVVIKYGILITVVGFLFLRAMHQLRKEQDAEQTTVVVATDPQKAELANQKYQRKNVIPFLAVRAFLSLIIGLFGVSLVFDGQLLWGVIVLLLGGGLCVLHIHWIVQCLKTLKEQKNERNDDSHG